MAKKVHEFKYTSQELDDMLARLADKPFVMWHDENAGVYRFFTDEERMNIWIEAYNSGELTPEIDAYQFIDPITAPAPYTINITVTNDNLPILYGTEGNTVDFTFETLDGNGTPVPESVDVYYTFKSASGTKTTSAVYNAGIEVSMNIDKYLSIGKNTVAIMVKGRATGTTKTIVATYNVVKLNLNSTFNFAIPREPSEMFEVEYTLEGDGDRIVEFYIDGMLRANPVTSSIEGTVTKRQALIVDSPGKHTLQMVAKMQVGTHLFKSRLLYYEFIIRGVNLTTTLLAESFDSNTNVFMDNTLPGLHGEQYVIKELNWAYYSSDYNMYNATIVWRLYNPGGENIPIATRTADVIEASSSELPEPLKFMPTEVGSYHLQALIDDTVINVPNYTISIVRNTSGILESTNGMTMKLSGLGRSNNEPEETLDSWESKINNIRYETTFYNQPWNANSGWNNNALVLNGGATAVINNKPFATEVYPTTRSGCVFEIDFETFNVLDENTELLRIGGIGTACLVITASKAMLKASGGTTIVSRFKSDERIKIAFVVYPKNTSDYPGKVFVYNNGVMSGVVNYDVAENFNMGSIEDTESPIGMINLGNPSGNAGIKIYYIRTYSNYISMYEELNNYFIDSGENLNYLVADNDIYSSGKLIDVDKLEGTITTVKLTGPLNEIIGTGSKDNKLTCKLEVSSPTDSSINLRCDKAQVNKAGQSTLDKPVPSFHVRLDKIDGNVCYDRDGRIYPKNRWTFRQGNVPEKKFRLQANYMDSSGCHNAAFFRLINEVYPKVQINGEKVLRIPSEKYATDIYPSAMESIYGEDPSGNNWKFPYKINICPDSIPCIVVWRPDDDSSYRFLGQYVIMEEKKANYANGMHSIYSGLDSKGNADPFGFNSTKSGIKLWDNKDCHQMEFLRSTSPLELLYDDTDYATLKEDSFELVFPDDLTPEEIQSEWNKFYNDVVHPICSSYNDQSAFEDLFYGTNPKLDRWGFAAYYCLVMRNACSDSLVRNMELVTYDGHKWTPKWWDVDMQCGLQQSGACDIEPTSTRDTEISPGVYAFSGRITIGGDVRSSWLWDALEASEQFMHDVEVMDAALYEAGWRYSEITKIQDEEYVDTWSNALYNESGIVKYLTYDELNYKSLQGDRTPHRHWFLRTSYDYFDALHVCGDYTTKRFETRTISIDPPKKIYITASATSYFGWECTDTIFQSGIKIEKGETGYITIHYTPHYQDPLHILGANKIAELDMHEISTNLYADIDFSATYDDVLGSQLQKIILGTGDGTTKTRLNNGEFNTNARADIIGGISTLTKLEYLDIQGMHSLRTINLGNNSSLKHFYAAGTSLAAFNPANGSALTNVELPTTLTSMTMNACRLSDNDNHCLIKWYKTNYTNNVPTSVELATVPTSLIALSFTSMGNDMGVKELVFDWLRAHDDAGTDFDNLDITVTNVNWENVDLSDILLLAKIPAGRRKITGRITIYGTMTSQTVVALQEAFGEHVFEYSAGNSLIIDASQGFVLALPDEIIAGSTTVLKAVSFPVASGSGNINYSLGHYVNGNYVAVAPVNGVYSYMGAIVYKDSETGNSILQISETQDNDYEIGIHGDNGINGADMPIMVRKRVYPSSIDFAISHTIGKDVAVDTENSSVYVTSDNVVIDVDVETNPEEITGTVVSETWDVSENIIEKWGIVSQDANHLQLNITNAGETLTTGSITHTKVYCDNYTVSKTYIFMFQSPVYLVTTAVNAPLQEALYNSGVALHSANFTYNYEVWSVTDLDTIGIFDSGSTLVHLGELNDFIHLTMDTLDLSNCTLAGSQVGQIQLENRTYDYVDIFPRASQTLIFDFREINLSNTQYKGINLKQGNVLETITYGDYTEEVVLVNQSALTEVNIPDDAPLDKLIIENCNELEEITWI